MQAYFAYYNPSNGWTGRVTASSLGFDAFGNVTIAATPNWDASCVLTGVPTGTTCSTTGDAGLIAPDRRNLPAHGQRPPDHLPGTAPRGMPFQYSNLTAAQQAAIDQGRRAPPAIPALNDVPTASTTCAAIAATRSIAPAVGEFRRRTSVLADIMDSSPTWVGAPGSPYAVNWNDRLNTTATMPENGSSAQTYAAYITAQLKRQQVVYVGANDGLLHGFRSGVYNSSSATARPRRVPAASPTMTVWKCWRTCPVPPSAVRLRT